MFETIRKRMRSYNFKSMCVCVYRRVCKCCVRLSVKKILSILCENL